MSTDKINPVYKLIERDGGFGISATEMSTGENTEIKLALADKTFAELLCKMLNENAVSIHHSKAVIRDKLIEGLLE